MVKYKYKIDGIYHVNIHAIEIFLFSLNWPGIIYLVLSVLAANSNINQSVRPLISWGVRQVA